MKQRWRLLWILGVLSLVASPVALATVTFDRGGSGEVGWTREPVCGPMACATEDWAVELATFHPGDWAVVWLDACGKFTVDQISSLDFLYLHLEYNVGAGPRLALSLERYEPASGTVVQYLAITEPAPQNLRNCAWYAAMFPTGFTWCYSKWDGTNIDSYEIASQTCGLALAQLKAALSGASVLQVGVFMGVVGWPTPPGPVGTGKAVVDDVRVVWTGPCGGTYDLERPWPMVYDFEDNGDDQWVCHEYVPGEDPSAPDFPEKWDEWTSNGLWKIVKVAELFGEPAAVKAFPSPTHAFYFGTPDPVTGKGSYNGTGSRVSGELTSPVNYLNPGDQFVDISFWYYRHVESYKGPYPQQVYDRTWVEIRWYYDACQTPGWGPWLQKDSKGNWFWYKDSSNPPEGAWTQAVLPTLEVPCCATRIQFRFVFDSIDGYNNNYLGWIIDNVMKTHSCQPQCLEITTDFLPQWTVKVDQCFRLTANKPGARWEVVTDPREGGADPLPPRLTLEKGTGLICGHPEVGTAGTYKIRIKATWGDGKGCNVAYKTFTLAIRSPASGANIVYQENFDPPSGGNGWLFCELWHQTEEVWINNETQDIVTPPGTALPGPGDHYRSAYFGQNDPKDGVAPNYIGKGGRVKCCLTSPLIPIDPKFSGEEIVLGFKSWREVEFYAGGAFDKTWVEVKFEGQDWKQVWYKDSKNPSEPSWNWVEVRTGLIVPAKPWKFQVRFCFDSVDGYNNNYVGWLVDEVTVYAGSTLLTIVGCPLPEGSVGAVYKAKISASGGPVGTKSIRVTNLPPGLEWDATTDEIKGIPREAGTWKVKIVATIYDPSMNPIASAEKECDLVVKEQTVLLFEDFEADPKWQWGGLWHRTSDAGVKGVTKLGADNHAAYYGKDDTTSPNYNTGDRTTGALTLISPVIDLTGVLAVKVSFDYWREVESFGGAEYDLTLVQVRIGTGSWTTVWKRSSKDASSKAWLTENTIHFLVPTGSTQMLIRFVFDSVDKWYNSSLGWIVDNIRVDKAPTAGAKPLSALAIAPAVVEPRGVTISFFNFPNPVRDVHTTTFTVRGVEADRIKVEIYDLAGRLVYTNEVPGSELVWHTQDLTGLPLANGVYLYKVYVKVGETWVVSGVQKLTVLR